MPDRELVVLGAGPAGLAAAWWAARAGHDVLLVEREAHVGGLAASFTVAGVRVDHGSHRLHAATARYLLGDLQRLLGDDLQRRRRCGRIRIEGRWAGFPLRPLDLLAHLPIDFTGQIARDRLTARRRRQPGSGGPSTFAEDVRARVGPALAERFYFPYARKLWGVEPEELDGEQARRRVGSSPGSALLRRRSFFWYPRHGFGQISEALAGAASAAGADLWLGREVTAIDASRQRPVVTMADGTSVAADRVWSTLPVPLFSRLAGGPTAGALSFRPMTLVYLALPVRQLTPFDAHYYPGPETPVSRVSEPRNYRDGPDPDDRTVICAEVPGDVTPAEVDLVALGLPHVEPFEVVCKRLARAYPIYRPGWDTGLAEVDVWLSKQPRLLSFGRGGLFAHDNTHHALDMAWEATRALRTDGTFDNRAWSRARARFRRHVVED